jgi:hypothetical protein
MPNISKGLIVSILLISLSLSTGQENKHKLVKDEHKIVKDEFKLLKDGYKIIKQESKLIKDITTDKDDPKLKKD